MKWFPSFGFQRRKRELQEEIDAHLQTKRLGASFALAMASRTSSRVKSKTRNLPFASATDSIRR
jgi:hypothetical protein